MHQSLIRSDHLNRTPNFNLNLLIILLFIMDSIEFNLNPSKFLTLLLIIIYLGAGAALCLVNTIPIVKILLLLIGLPILAYLGSRDLKKHIWQKDLNSIVRLWQNCEGKWGCETGKGRLMFTDILGDSFISSFLIVLRLKTKTRIMKVIIARDSLKDEEFRMLLKRILFF